MKARANVLFIGSLHKVVYTPLSFSITFFPEHLSYVYTPSSHIHLPTHTHTHTHIHHPVLFFPSFLPLYLSFLSLSYPFAYIPLFDSMPASMRYADKLEAELFHEVKPSLVEKLLGHTRGRKRWDRTRTRVVPDDDDDNDEDTLWDSDDEEDELDDNKRRRQKQKQQMMIMMQEGGGGRRGGGENDYSDDIQAVYMTTIRKLRQPVQDLRIHTALANVYHKSKPMAVSFVRPHHHFYSTPSFSQMFLDYSKQQQLLQRRPSCRYLMMLLETPTHLVRQNQHPVHQALCRRRRSFVDTNVVMTAASASSSSSPCRSSSSTTTHTSSSTPGKRLRSLSAWSQRVMRRDKQQPSTVVLVESLVQPQQQKRDLMQWHSSMEAAAAAAAARIIMEHHHHQKVGYASVPLRQGWYRQQQQQQQPDDDQDEVPLGLLRKRT